MFNQKIKNSYLFFLMLNAFLLMTLPVFTQKIFAQNNEEHTQKQTQITHAVHVQDDTTDIVETINNSFNDKNTIGMAKVVDELKNYALSQHTDKASKKMILDVVSSIINDYLCINEWAEVQTDFFKVFAYDSDNMKDIVTAELTYTTNLAITLAKNACKTSSYNFIFDAFAKDMNDAVADTISTLWPTLS
ncbi:MAG: putative secreted protein [Candidatus Phytoplasma pruni]|nr:MAG: putative secreted protein [Candidatus Phytoplasma pruni]